MTDSTQAALDRLADALGARRKPQPSYFVVMVDLGRLGLTANVEPEKTRADIIHDIKHAQHFGEIAFIHHICDGQVEDVTREIIDAAEIELKTEARERADQIAAERDHAYHLLVEAV
jgi:hypothetical protein